MKKNFLIVSIVLLALVACGKKAEKSDTTPKNDTSKVIVEIDSMAFEVDTFHVSGKDKNCKKEDCSTCEIYYERIKMPLLPVHDSVNRYIDTFMLKALNDISGDRDIKNIQKMAQDFIDGSHDPDLGFGGAWSWDHNTTITRSVAEIISVNSNYGGYAGGAHGNYYMETANFLTTNGKLLTMNDVFTDVAAVNKIGLKYFKKDNDLSADMDLIDQGWDYEDDNFKLNDNFDISLESIIWQYNFYEIGPYSNGAPSVKIPMKEIEKYLKFKFTEVKIK